MLMATLGRRKSNLEKLLGAIAALVGIGFVLHLLLGARADATTRAPLGFAEPFLRLGAGVHDRAASVWIAFFDGDRLRRENDELRGQLLEAQLAQATESTERTLAELTEQVSTNLPVGSLELLTVPVLAAKSATDRQVLWLAMGTREGIAPGMTVLGPAGIIGLVERCTESMALVRLITDRKSSWGAQVEGSGELGLLVGTGDGETVELHFSRTVTAAEAGLRVTSSGMSGSIAPSTLPFGEIIEVGKNRKSEPMALVKLPGDPSRLRTVWVLPEQRIVVSELRP